MHPHWLTILTLTGITCPHCSLHSAYAAIGKEVLNLTLTLTLTLIITLNSIIVDFCSSHVRLEFTMTVVVMWRCCDKQFGL